MNKKLLSTILALLMLTTLFSGCGNTGDEASAAPEETTPATQAAAESEAPDGADDAAGSDILPITGEVMTYSYFFSIKPPLVTYINSLQDNPTWAEIQNRTNIHFDFIEVSAEVSSDQMNILIAAEEYPDIMPVSKYPIAYIDQGITIDLSELLTEYAPNITAVLEQDESARKFCYSDDGRIPALYGIYTEELEITYGPQVRKDWLDELDMDSPVTYDDYYEMLTAFKTEMGATGPLLLMSDVLPQQDYLVAGYGVAGICNNMEVPYMIDDTGTVQLGVVQDEFKEFLTMMSKWYADGLIHKDFVTNFGYSPSDELIFTNDAGLWYADQTQISYYTTMGKDIDPDFEVAAIQDAVFNEGDTTHFRFPPRHVATGSGVSLSSTCPEPENIIKLFDYMFTEEGQLLANYGIEDVTFTMENGTPVYTDLIMNNELGLSMTDALYIYVQEYFVTLIDQDRMKQGMTQAEIDAPEIWGTDKDNDYDYPKMEVSLTDEEQVIIDAHEPDIKTCIQENTAKFITGERGLDTFDEFVQTIADMNLEAVLEVYQNAYERYQSR